MGGDNVTTYGEAMHLSRHAHLAVSLGECNNLSARVTIGRRISDKPLKPTKCFAKCTDTKYCTELDYLTTLNDFAFNNAGN